MVFDNIGIKVNIEPLENSLSKPMVNQRQQFISKVLNESARIFVGLVHYFAPKDTGAYAMSWRILEVTNKQATIGSDEDMLFVVLEFGVDREIEIRVKNAKALAIKLKSGETIFRKSATLPPRPPQPHLRKAIKLMKKIFRDVVFANQGEVIPAWRQSTRRNRQTVNSFKSQYNIK